MKKIIALLTAVLFASSNAAFAAGVALSDKQLEGVAAGDWVVLDDSVPETVADVYNNNNTLDLSDSSQTQLQAVSNANLVDSAAAVQSNISSVEGDFPLDANANQKNEADVTNLNPSEAGSESHKTWMDWLTVDSRENHSTSNSKFSIDASWGSNYDLTETLDITKTKDIVWSKATSTEKDCKNCEEESVSAQVFLLDFDYNLDYDKTIHDKSSGEFHLSKVETDLWWDSYTKMDKQTSHTEKSSSHRKSQSENNHLNLKGHSQEFTQAVSNLNAVGSAAAIQTNIASNVGMAGTISGTNIATVSNGF